MGVEKYRLKYLIIDIHRNDWFDQLELCSHIIWRPNLQEPFLQQAKEKLYMLENIAKKYVYPSMDTFWHYDNKNAQKYMFDLYKIKSPKGYVSYSYVDTLDYLKNCNYPQISKSTAGAGSRNVRKLNSFREAKSELKYLFKEGLHHKILFRLLNQFNLKQNTFFGQRFYINYQEYIPDNKGDFRVTVIGGKYAFAFFRLNREGDFRASGSGNIDYSHSYHNVEAIRYCLKISQQFGFDSMCYDILYTPDDFVIAEFSYIFQDIAIYDCDGYYIQDGDKLKFIKGKFWPQELIIRHLITEKWKLI